MRRIELSQGKYALVDDSDYEALSQYKWSLMKIPKKDTVVLYAYRKEGNKEKGKTLYMHREILGDIDVGLQVDHINRDGLDNRRENLRAVTASENLKNRNGYGSSMCKGVTHHKKSGKWYAQIYVNGTTKHIGSFATEQEASDAYQDRLLEIN